MSTLLTWLSLLFKQFFTIVLCAASFSVLEQFLKKKKPNECTCWYFCKRRRNSFTGNVEGTCEIPIFISFNFGQQWKCISTSLEHERKFALAWSDWGRTHSLKSLPLCSDEDNRHLYRQGWIKHASVSTTCVYIWSCQRKNAPIVSDQGSMLATLLFSNSVSQI